VAAKAGDAMDPSNAAARGRESIMRMGNGYELKGRGVTSVVVVMSVVVVRDSCRGCLRDAQHRSIVTRSIDGSRSGR
jgi:hypothetical protein